MANDFTTAEMRMFEDVVAGYDSMDVVSRDVPTFTADMKGAVRSGNTFHRPIPMISRVVTGLDMTGEYRDVTGLQIPVSFATSDITNIPFTFDAVELNDETRRNCKAQSVAQALAADLDVRTMDVAANQGTLVVKQTAALSTYDHYSEAESIMIEQGVSTIADARGLYIPVRTWNQASAALANRTNFEKGAVQGAYENSLLPRIAGFDTHKVDYSPLIVASSAGATTVNGAQSHIPVPNNVTTGNIEDNRFMDLTVNSSANWAVGDAFTIASLNAAHHIKKTDTGQLKTFRVLAVPDGTTLTISPAIVDINGANQAEKEYGNVVGQAGNGSALTPLNIANDNPTVFFRQDAMEIVKAATNDEDLGPAVAHMSAGTANGFEITMYRQGEINDLSTRYRYKLWAKPTLLHPEMAGIIQQNQV